MVRARWTQPFGRPLAAERARPAAGVRGRERVSRARRRAGHRTRRERQMEELPRRNPGSEECDGRVYKAIHEVAKVYGATLGALRTETSTWESKQEKVNVRSDGGGNKSYKSIYEHAAI